MRWAVTLSTLQESTSHTDGEAPFNRPILGSFVPRTLCSGPSRTGSVFALRDEPLAGFFSSSSEVLR